MAPVSVRWVKDMEFSAEVSGGETMTLDSRPRDERPGPGPSPMDAVEAALAGCTGIDVIGILKKMRTLPEDFRIEVHSTRAEDHPRVFTRMEVVYHLEGSSLQADSVLRAIELSQDKYCSVAAMLRPTVELPRKVFLNGEQIG